MTGAFAAKTASTGIFWLVAPANGKARLLTAGCALDAAELYGAFLTFADGHYAIWEGWRRADGGADADLRGILNLFEYEDWPRGRIVFNRPKKRFILYADRKLLRPETIAAIERLFALPPDRTDVETDFHYQSAETPGPFG